eukprot:gene28897-34872_t
MSKGNNRKRREKEAGEPADVLQESFKMLREENTLAGFSAKLLLRADDPGAPRTTELDVTGTDYHVADSEDRVPTFRGPGGESGLVLQHQGKSNASLKLVAKDLANKMSAGGDPLRGGTSHQSGGSVGVTQPQVRRTAPREEEIDGHFQPTPPRCGSDPRSSAQSTAETLLVHRRHPLAVRDPTGIQFFPLARHSIGKATGEEHRLRRGGSRRMTTNRRRRRRPLRTPAPPQVGPTPRSPTAGEGPASPRGEGQGMVGPEELLGGGSSPRNAHTAVEVWKKAFDVSMTSLSLYFDANTATFTNAVVDNMKEVATLVYRNSFLEVQVDVPALGDDSEEAKQLLHNAREQLVAAVKRGAEEGQILKVTLAMPKLGGRVSEVMSLHSSAGQFNDEVPKLDCYILPQGGSDLGSNGLTWPLFSVKDVKQTYAVGMSMLFDRCGRADIGRKEHTLRELESGSFTAWVGLPGIGKSVASQSVLMGAIRKLGRGPSDIPMVFYRARMKLFVIYLDEDGNVEVKYLDGGVNLDALDTITGRVATPFQENKYFKQPVLILELDEKESDPLCPIPFHVSTSSRQADQTLKSIFKVRAPFYLVQPWFEEELRMMYWLLDWSGSLAQYPHVHDWYGKFLEFGGVPREFFRSKKNLPVDVKGLEEKALSEIRELSPYNLGQNAKRFIAPVIRPGVMVPLLNDKLENFTSTVLDASSSSSGETPDNDPDSGNQEGVANTDTWKFSFLNFKTARIMETAVKRPAELKAFQRFGLEYQYHESLVLYGGVLKTPISLYQLPASLQAPSWQWHAAGKTAPLSAHQVQALLSSMPDTSRLYSFPSQVYVCPVGSLDASRTYRSSVVNGYLYDFMTVNHAHKLVYFWQVSTMTPKEHAVSLNVLEKVLNGLNMWGGQSPDYKIVYIYCSPHKSKVPPVENLSLYVKIDKTVMPWKSACNKNTTMEREGKRLISAYFAYFNEDGSAQIYSNAVVVGKVGGLFLHDPNRLLPVLHIVLPLIARMMVPPEALYIVERKSRDVSDEILDGRKGSSQLGESNHSSRVHVSSSTLHLQS